ncbi:hypothetical protein PPERSA_04242 [Pseudocohnilembus persalinus]|uniref:Kri1-like C-terminal domain-containing protein n=1 Tax=Pseudocohnilembus persalinus TaxID=266149 RepID=A0A0V0QNA9_PSEPJ|nr:hypothetical protein PPERSA_04242 [Pseudocohnilembus persalinus]|eukprot:KRX03734.1 hypothetical protein PPERSA_04242 [Pseudocohnilembus persalinus]
MSEPKSILKKKNKNILENSDDSDNEQQEFKFKQADKKVTQKIDKKLQRNYIERAKNRLGKKEYEKLVKKAEKQERLESGIALTPAEEEYFEDSSDDEPEDEFGVLDNKDQQKQFFQTLAKIKTKNPEIYDSKKEFFSDIQIDEDEVQEKQKKQYTYKEMVADNVKQKMEKEGESESDSDDDQRVKKQAKKLADETPYEEQQRIKREFKEKSKKIFGNMEEEEGDDDEENGGLFTVKKKSQKEIQEEDENFSNFKKSHKSEDEDVKTQKLVKKLWGKEDALDEKDKFLRDYILNQAWIDKDEYDEAKIDEQVDKEDEERDEDFEQFEHEYNFRFEEPGANQIMTYERNIEGSIRQKDNTRAEKRKKKQQEKEEKKQQMEEQIKVLKNAKKQELIDRIRKISQSGGLKESKIMADERFQQFLEKEFDQEEYDKIMSKKFGKKYDSKEDRYLEELKKYDDEMEEERENIFNEQQNKQLQQNKAQKGDKDVTDIKVNIPIAKKKNITKEEVEAMTKNAVKNEEENTSEEEYNMVCWYCDNCERGLQPGEVRFDCQECPDYVLCIQCQKTEIHNHHRLKKLSVPQNCAPPEDSQLKQIISQFKICKKCDCKLNEYTDIYTLNSNEKYTLCDECFDKEKYTNQQNFTCTKATKVDISQLMEKGDLTKVQEHFSDDVIGKLVDEYYGLDFEDIIAGGIKTRFKYKQVKPESYGLSDEHLLYSDPKILNSYVSLKKIAPYREDEGQVSSKLLKNKAKLNQIQNSTRLVKYQIRKEDKKIKILEERIKKLKKGKKNENKIAKYQQELQKIKNQKIQPLTQEFFKQLKHKQLPKKGDDENVEEEEDDDIDSADISVTDIEDEEEERRQKKKNKMQIQDLSHLETQKKNISSSRLKSYGIEN